MTRQPVEPNAFTGLSTAAARKRLARFGENMIREEPVSSLSKFLTYSWGPIPLMIEAGADLSAVTQRRDDFGMIIIGMPLIKVGWGVFEGHRVDTAIKVLQQRLGPGDVISVKLDNIVPADVTLRAGNYLGVDEPALSEATLLVDEKVGDNAYAETIVRQGARLVPHQQHQECLDISQLARTIRTHPKLPSPCASSGRDAADGGGWMSV